MEKWADYLVSAVRYESSNGEKAIKYLRVHSDLGEKMGAGFTWTVSEVKEMMKAGKSFATILRDVGDEFRKGRVLTEKDLTDAFRIDDQPEPMEGLQEL